MWYFKPLLETAGGRPDEDDYGVGVRHIWVFTQFDTKRFITSTAKNNVLGKHAAYELSEENVMPELSRRQKAIIANFLQVSRKHFDLSHRNIDLQTYLQHSGRTIIQSLLIAGSVGIGGTAYAEPVFTGAETRAERITRETPSTADEWKARPPVERMP